MKELDYLPKFRVYISDVCQLNCLFCGGNNGHMESFECEGRQMLSDSKIMNIIKAYIRCGGRDIQFTGGEPLLNPMIVDHCKMICSMGARAEINSNGIALTESMAKSLADAGVNEIKISLPGFTRKSYLHITGRDYFDIVTNNIKKASKYIKVRVNTVATKTLLKELDEIFKYCVNNDIHSLALLELCYFPDLMTLDYFRSEYVNIPNQYGTKIEQILGVKREDISFRSDFRTPISVWKNPDTGFSIACKRNDIASRCDFCNKCEHFCQEGMYQLRLSAGGYLNFCNFVTPLGQDLAPYVDSPEKLDDAFYKASKIWKEVYKTEKNDFFAKLGMNIQMEQV